MIICVQDKSLGKIRKMDDICSGAFFTKKVGDLLLLKVVDIIHLCHFCIKVVFSCLRLCFYVVPTLKSQERNKQVRSNKFNEKLTMTAFFQCKFSEISLFP